MADMGRYIERPREPADGRRRPPARPVLAVAPRRTDSLALMVDQRSDQSTDGNDKGDNDEGNEGVGRPAKRLDRVRTSVQSATIEPGRSNFSIKWAIDRLDNREKRFSFAAAGGAALFALTIYFAETSNPHFRLAKNQLTPQGSLTVGLIAAGLLVATTIIGRRAPVGFVALLTGAAFGGSFFFLGLPFFALAVWLLYRSYKLQRETAANVRAASRSGTGPSSGPRQPSTASVTRNRRAKGPATPSANKRYTPKRPPPPAPKPPRRERKASRTAD